MSDEDVVRAQVALAQDQGALVAAPRGLELTREQLGGLVCETLFAHGMDAVLSGGSCVSIWSNNAYVSDDLDMIIRGMATRSRIARALADLGFTPDKSGSRYFTHPDIKLSLEFPSGPLMVGDEHVTDVETISTDHGTLKLLTPTDCVKDRMAGYLHWGDEQSFQQAVHVAKNQPVDWDSIAKWFAAEGYPGAFRRFRKAVDEK